MQTNTQPRTLKKPVDAFPKCPSCLMGEFLKDDTFNVFCDYCGWDSVAAYAAFAAEYAAQSPDQEDEYFEYQSI